MVASHSCRLIQSTRNSARNHLKWATEKTEVKKFSATCLCRGIECEISPPTIESAHCHCRYCRQAHGAAFVTWLIVPERQFKILKGNELLRSFQSSEQSCRSFCSRCGSTLLYRSKLCEGEIHVARALIEGPVDHEPAANCFSDHTVAWLGHSSDLPDLPADSDLLSHYREIKP